MLHARGARGTVLVARAAFEPTVAALEGQTRELEILEVTVRVVVTGRADAVTLRLREAPVVVVIVAAPGERARESEERQCGEENARAFHGGSVSGRSCYFAGRKNTPRRSSVLEIGAASPLPGWRQELTRNW